MNKLGQRLQLITKTKRIGLMTHVVVGYPSLSATEMIVRTMAESGVDFIELQIPFSDPLADGPTIMRACESSLSQGTRVADAFMVMQKLSVQVSIPLFFMAYYNTVFHYGVEQFCKDAHDAGAAGLIVPDMPIDEEEHEQFYFFCKKYELTTIQVISPASTDARIAKNKTVAAGFVYCTARQGTTGAKAELEPKLNEYLTKIKASFELPIAVGFGISKREHIQALAGKADIAVIGSALIELIAKTSEKDRQKAIKHFLTGMLQ